MAKIERFEDLECWKAARELVKFIYSICLKGKLAKDFDTQRQLKKAGLSTMNNIAEGFSRYHKRDSIHFYDISQSSAAEVKSISYVLEDLEYLELKYILELREKNEKTKNLTLGFIKYLNKS
jgi:four helix bundle protein